MFSSGLLEKSSPNVSDNSSPSRSKFTVGINPLADENQQNIRIQVAVNRYNNAANSPIIRPINERSFSSPFKHAFSRSSQKYNNFEMEREGPLSNRQKPFNQYQGVGNFPVVHLKKNAVISKPIKRNANSEFKIQLPELPFNKFLNHSPDLYTDEKTSTRSVLDVLQDLSRKRIHTKDDNEINKRKCKGLGGDIPLDFEAPYKPLFMPKTKTHNIVTRDSTTQTQDFSSFENSSLKKDEVIAKNDPKDPKAELRKRLAHQNNEIVASLSSSTLTYPVKRRIDKLISDEERNKKSEKVTKRVKYFTKENREANDENGSLSSRELTNNGFSINHSSLTEKKHKMGDTNKISPNKDRLTSIFLEMKATGSNVKNARPDQKLNETEVLHSPASNTSDIQRTSEPNTQNNSSDANHSGNVKDNSSKSVGDDQSVTVEANGTPVSKTILNNSSEERVTLGQKASNVSNDGTIGTKETNISENNISSNGVTSGFGIPVTSNIFIDSSTSIFKPPVASTVSITFTQTPIFSTGISFSQKNDFGGNNVGHNVNSDAKSNEVKSKSLPDADLAIKAVDAKIGTNLAPGVVPQEGNAATFKFGVDNFKVPNSQYSSSVEKQETVKTAGDSGNIVKDAANNLPPPINFGMPINTVKDNAVSGAGTSTIASNSSEDNSNIQLSNTDSKSKTPSQISLSFSQNQQKAPVFNYTDKTVSLGNNASDKLPVFPFTFGATNANNSTQPLIFNVTNEKSSNANIGEKSVDENTLKKKSDNNEKVNVTSSESTSSSQSQNSFQTTTFSLAPGAESNCFTQNASNIFKPNDQNVAPFKFGDKVGASNNKQNSDSVAVSTSTGFDSKAKSNVFTFGSKSQSENTPGSTSQPVSTQSNLFPSNVFSFGQKSTPAVALTSNSAETTPSFMQNSTSPNTQSNLFQQNMGSQPSSTANSTKSSIPPFGQSSFGQGTSSFSNVTNIFGTNSSQTAPVFGVGSTPQNSPFGQSFGDSANKQQNTFGQSSNFFLQSSSSKPTEFGQGSGFGANTFGQTQANQGNNIFGQKGSGCFNQSDNAQGTPFSQNSTTPAFGSQAPFTFGASNTSATTSAFSMNPPNKSGSVFTFSGTATSSSQSTSTFNFSNPTQSNSNTQSPFSFSGQSSNTFQFGSPTSKETPTFGGGSARTFSFDANITSSVSAVPKTTAPIFTFGGSQGTSSNAGFNFGASPSPSVFNFGGSGSSGSSVSKFSFSATPPNSGIFTPGVTPSPSSVPLQGVFSIGSGSAQPRSRSLTSRPRRRP